MHQQCRREVNETQVTLMRVGQSQWREETKAGSETHKEGTTKYDRNHRLQAATLQCTHRSSCRSGPQPGTPLGPPEPSPSAGPRVRRCRPHTGSGSCSSSASPQFSWSPSARRSRQSSRRWGSLGGPGHYPTGSYCLWEGGSVKRWNITEAKKYIF